MCGKFTQMGSWREVLAFSEPLTLAPDDEIVTATPMRFAHVMRLNADGAREMVPMRWGFSDKAAHAPDRPKHMHARAETIDTRPTFADAFANARGLLFVHTFNEGEELESGKAKQWVFTPKDDRPLAIAVIFEEWVRAELGGREETLLTFVMATTPANALISTITDRMPAILPEDAWATWLGETDAPLGEVKALLQTYDDGGGWEMSEQAKGGRRPSKDDGQPSLF